MNLIAYVLTKPRNPKDIVRQMSIKSCFRRPYDKQHGKRSQTLLKYAWQLLLYLLINMKKIEFEGNSISGM